MICVLLVVDKATTTPKEKLDTLAEQRKEKHIKDHILKRCIAGKLFVVVKNDGGFSPDSYQVTQVFDTDANGKMVAVTCKEQE